jgi:hypothetical protein
VLGRVLGTYRYEVDREDQGEIYKRPLKSLFLGLALQIQSFEKRSAMCFGGGVKEGWSRGRSCTVCRLNLALSSADLVCYIGLFLFLKENERKISLDEKNDPTIKKEALLYDNAVSKKTIPAVASFCHLLLQQGKKKPILSSAVRCASFPTQKRGSLKESAGRSQSTEQRSAVQCGAVQ